jgi:hypothetical protein
MRDFTKFYVVYDFLTPNGYVPFNYQKENLSNILKNTITDKKSFKEKYPNHKKTLTHRLTPQMLNDNSNTFLVVVKNKRKSILDGIDLNKILSKKLKEYIEIFDNFKIIES